MGPELPNMAVVVVGGWSLVLTHHFSFGRFVPYADFHDA